MRTRSTPAWFVVATTPRMLALLLVLLVAAGLCVRLGAWQLDRAQERGERAAAARALAEADAPPEPLDDVAAPQSPLTAEMVGRRVVASGTYVDGAVVVVPDTDQDGRTGTLVVAGLRVAEGAGAGAILPVLRGWVEADAATTLSRLGPGGDLAPPAGAVRVVGALAASEAALGGRFPDGAVGSISAGQLVNLWGGPIYGGHLRLEASTPTEPGALVPVPGPASGGAGLDLRNLAYAAQWWIFGGFAVLLWVRLVRDEVGRRRD